MRRFKFLAIIVTMLLVFTACGAKKDEILKQETNIPETETKASVVEPEVATDYDIAVFAVGEWAPYVSENLPNYGFTADVVKQAYGKVGIEVKFEFYPWNRAIEMAKKSEVVGSFPWIFTAERLAEYNMTDPFCFNEEKFTYLKDNPKMPKKFSADGLKNLRVSSVSGYSHDNIMSELGIKFDISNNEEDAFKKMMEGRIDTYPANPLVSDAYVKQLYPDRINDVAYLEPSLMRDDMGIMISKAHPESQYYIDKFNEGLKQLVDSGEYNEILIKCGLEILIVQ